MRHLVLEVLLHLTIEAGAHEQLHQLINNVLLHQVEAVPILHLPGLHLPTALQGAAVDLQEVQEVAVVEVEEGINSLFFFYPSIIHPLSNTDFLRLILDPGCKCFIT